MKYLFTLFFLILSFTFVGFKPAQIQAQSSAPAVVLSPSNTFNVGSRNDIILSLVNMGVPLDRVELVVRFYGQPAPYMNLSYENGDFSRFGWILQGHYFMDAPDQPGAQDLYLKLKAANPGGYNQGSMQVPLATISYTVEPGTFYTQVLVDKTKVIAADGQTELGFQDFGTRSYRALSTSASAQDISSYSLSFESDPVRKWWPTAPNSVQQIDAAVYKDSDGRNVKNFSNLRADWRVDPQYLEIVNTSSSYFDNCPVPMAGNRPCIRFVAHVITKNPGNSYISLYVTDNDTGKEVWNSYGLQVYSLNETSPIPAVSGGAVVSPQPFPSIATSPIPSPVFYNQDTVSSKEFEEIQQKVTYLEGQLEQQQAALEEHETLLHRIASFLRRLFRF